MRADAVAGGADDAAVITLDDVDVAIDDADTVGIGTIDGADAVSLGGTTGEDVFCTASPLGTQLHSCDSPATSATPLEGKHGPNTTTRPSNIFT